MRLIDADKLLEQLGQAALSPASRMIVRMLVDDAPTVSGLTKEDCAVITAYTGVAMLKGNDLKYLYDYLSGFIGRPIFTHEIPAVCETYKEQIKADFITICLCAVDSAHLIPPPENSKALPTCSACGAEIMQLHTNFCGCCGAKMDGGAGNV